MIGIIYSVIPLKKFSKKVFPLPENFETEEYPKAELNFETVILKSEF